MDKNGSDEIKISENNDAIEIKIRTMFCRLTPTLRIDKHVGVGVLKEEVTLVTGVLAEHQRLIFRGKALRDDKQLSDYHVEDGDTLHLIVTTTSDPQESSSDEFNNRASNLSEQLPMITQMVSALLLSIGNATAALLSIYAMLVVISYDLVDEHRRAASLIRDLRRAASLSVGNRGSSSSSSSSRDQPAASLMNPPHVSLGNSNISHHTSAQLPMPNATAAALGNSIEETNNAAAAADAEDRSKDYGGSPDV